MVVVYCDAETQHAPAYEFEGSGFVMREHPERLGRGRVLRDALRDSLGLEIHPPGAITDADLLAVHTGDYIEFLKGISEGDPGLEPGAALGPDTFALRDRGQAPKDPTAAIGYYGTDPATPIVPGTWVPVRAAAAVAITGADIVADGGASYALCRPPGHHAGADYFGGFCYLNNAAIAAERLSRRGSVAVFDFDYHHGNGTQDIFYDSSRVFFASIHADPEFAYPHFYGYESQTGTGEGLGYTRNFPVGRDCSVAEYRSTLESAIEAIAQFSPEYIVVSVGYDAYEGDPVGGLCLTVEDFRTVGSLIASLRRPTLLVQEGGYAMDDLGVCAGAFVSGLLV